MTDSDVVGEVLAVVAEVTDFGIVRIVSENLGKEVFDTLPLLLGVKDLKKRSLVRTHLGGTLDCRK